jgi:hypothetical protein
MCIEEFLLIVAQTPSIRTASVIAQAFQPAALYR